MTFGDTVIPFLIDFPYDPVKMGGDLYLIDLLCLTYSVLYGEVDLFDFTALAWRCLCLDTSCELIYFDEYEIVILYNSVICIRIIH